MKDPSYRVPRSCGRIPLVVCKGNVGPRVERRPNNRASITPALLKLLGVDCARGSFNVGLLARRHPCICFSTSGLVTTASAARLCVCSPRSQRRFGCGGRKGTLRLMAKRSDAFCIVGGCYFSALRDTRCLMGRRGAIGGTGKRWNKANFAILPSLAIVPRLLLIVVENCMNEATFNLLRGTPRMLSCGSRERGLSTAWGRRSGSRDKRTNHFVAVGRNLCRGVGNVGGAKS